MNTLKSGLNQEDIDSNNLRTIITNYPKRDCVRIALYAAEDCFHINPTQKAQNCIDLVKKWLEDETSITKKELKTAADAYTVDSAAYCAANAAAYWLVRTIVLLNNGILFRVINVVDCAAESFGDNRESKLEEYKNYARLFAYEDLSYPHKDFAETFNLDDNDDLNIFLDFLTDNYHEAITYSREEYFRNKLAKEYLKVIYQ